MRRLSVIVAAVGLVVMGAGTVSAGVGRLSPDLQAVRSAVARFHSVEQAAAAGYQPGSPCESSPAGTMGVHYVNGPLAGDPAIDPLRPEVLLYLPDGSGDLKLVAVEYLRFDADQDLTTDGDRPSLFGQPFQGPMLGHGPGMPIHYDLHVWIAAANPSGLFAQWNPAIHCP